MKEEKKPMEISDEELNNVSGGACNGGGAETTGPVTVWGYALGYNCPQCHYDCWKYRSQAERERTRITYYYECEVCRKGASVNPGLTVPVISVSSGEGENAQKTTVTL